MQKKAKKVNKVTAKKTDQVKAATFALNSLFDELSKDFIVTGGSYAKALIDPSKPFKIHLHRYTPPDMLTQKDGNGSGQTVVKFSGDNGNNYNLVKKSLLTSTVNGLTKRSQVDEQITELISATDMLNSKLSQLQSRLQPVLIDSPPSMQSSAEDGPVLVATAARIRAEVVCVRSAIGVIDNLLDRLEI